MTQFVALDKRVEVNGETVLSIVNGMSTFKDGRLSVYSQIAGFYEIQRSISLRGEVEDYCYYGSAMGAACKGVDLAASQGQIQAAIDALPATGVDTGTAKFSVPELKAGDPGLDYSIRYDGTIVFYADQHGNPPVLGNLRCNFQFQLRGLIGCRRRVCSRCRRHHRDLLTLFDDGLFTFHDDDTGCGDELPL